MYNYLKQRFKHVIRFRHKRGFGVHSPFVFDLLTNVIKEKAVYYDFKRIESENKLKAREKKLDRMLFRLVDYLSYERVLFMGTTNVHVVDYLSAVSKDMVLFNVGPAYCLGKAGERRVFADVKDKALDLIYMGQELDQVWSPAWENLLKVRRRTPLCIVITDIYKKNLNTQVWKNLRQEGTVSIDMMWYGIAFFDERLQKGKYNMII